MNEVELTDPDGKRAMQYASITTKEKISLSTVVAIVSLLFGGVGSWVALQVGLAKAEASTENNKRAIESLAMSTAETVRDLSLSTERAIKDMETRINTRIDQLVTQLDTRDEQTRSETRQILRAIGRLEGKLGHSGGD